MQVSLDLTLAILRTYVAALGFNVLAAQLPAPRSASRGALAVVVAAPSLAGAFLLPPETPPAVIFLVAGFVCIQFLRVLEIVRDPSEFGRGARLFRILFAYETRAMKRVPRTFPIATWVASGAVFAAVVAIIALHITVGEPTTPYAPRGWPRWLATAVFGYLSLDGVSIHIRSILRPFGWEHAPIQRHPILSRSVSEFWGARWNTVISLGLRKNVFAPLARRGLSRAGLFASFVMSALLHVYMTLPAAGAAAAAWMGAFFLVHGVVTLLESRLGVRRWPVLAARAWTIAVFVVTMPLFAEPYLRSLGL